MSYDKRDYIVHRINDVLSASKHGVGVSKVEGIRAELLFVNQENYVKIIEEIIANSHLIYTCNYCEEVVEHIATEIAYFTDGAEEYFDNHNPFKREQDAIVQYQNYTEKEFAENWSRLHKALSSKYSKEQLDVEFYRDEFARHHFESRAYTLARYELFQDWQRQLSIRLIDCELRVISALRQKFEFSLREKLADFRLLIGQKKLDKVQIALFWSLGRGEWKQNTSDIFEVYATLIHENSSIERFIAELGRSVVDEDKYIIDATKIVGSKRFSHAQKSDIYGITQSDDLSSLLPLEVVMLSDSKLENDFYKRFTEKKLQTFSHQSLITECVEDSGKNINTLEHKRGPFIICIDTSASMCGIPEQLAKAICYGLIIESQEQKRNCFVITFSITVEVLDISDIRNNSKAIIDFLRYSFSGGTDLNPALEKAVEMLSNKLYRNADVLFISDFIAPNFKPSLVAAMSIAKESKTYFHALVIGDYHKYKLLSHFNMVWKYDSRIGQIVLEHDDK